MAKNQFIRARVANWEKFVISENARKARMTESEFVRRAVLEKDVVVIDGAAELLTELRRQGNNLNQLVILARQRRIELVNFQPFTEVYQDTWRALNSLLSRGA
jgi:hypothetical protein